MNTDGSELAGGRLLPDLPGRSAACELGESRQRPGLTSPGGENPAPTLKRFGCSGIAAEADRNAGSTKERNEA